MVTHKLRKLAALVLCVIAAPRLSAADSFDSALGLSGDIGLGGVDGQMASTVQTGIDLRERNVALGLQGRVRLMIDAAAEGSPVRRKDWDEVTDYLHILRYLTYQRRFATSDADGVTASARAGELLGYTLGHGSIVRDYSNIADPDHPHPGVLLQLKSSTLDVALMIDNFVNPSVIAGRAAVRPLSRLRALEIGGSLVVDPRAPVRVMTNEEGARQVDDAHRLLTVNQPLALAGTEVSITAGSEARGTLTPYVDLNTSFLGVGAHLGLQGSLPLGDPSWRLSGQLEYRGASSGYAPTHFGTFYDLERYQAGLAIANPRQATVAERSPKLAGLARGEYGGQGFLMQAGVGYRKLLQLKLGTSYQEGPDPLLLFCRASSTPSRRLNVGLLVLSRGLLGDSPAGAGVAAMGELRYRITDSLYTVGQYTRIWALRDDTLFYGVMQSFNLGLGASWSG